MAKRNKRQIRVIDLLARRFRRDERGAMMIEFGILAPIFFAVVGAILEISVFFLAGQILDGAVHDSARMIRIGQVQQQGINADGYRAEICDRLYHMFNCNELRISVRQLPSFANFSTGTPVDTETGDWTFSPAYQPGQGQTIVLVEAYYKWPTILAIPGLMSNVLPDGTRLLAAARVFRNEPFPWGPVPAS